MGREKRFDSLNAIPERIILNSAQKYFRVSSRHGHTHVLGFEIFSPNGIKINLIWDWENIVPVEGWYLVELKPVFSSGKYWKTSSHPGKGGIEGDYKVIPITKISKKAVDIIVRCGDRTHSGPDGRSNSIRVDFAVRTITEQNISRCPCFERAVRPYSKREISLWWEEFGDLAREKARQNHLKGPKMEAVIKKVSPDHYLAELSKEWTITKKKEEKKEYLWRKDCQEKMLKNKSIIEMLLEKNILKKKKEKNLLCEATEEIYINNYPVIKIQDDGKQKIIY